MNATFRWEDDVAHIGDRPFPDATNPRTVMPDRDDERFPPILRERGFEVPLGEGYVLSVVWGVGTHSENRFAIYDDFKEASATAEIAIRAPDGGLVPHGGGELIMGWMTTEAVLTIIDAARRHLRMVLDEWKGVGQ